MVNGITSQFGTAIKVRGRAKPFVNWFWLQDGKPYGHFIHLVRDDGFKFVALAPYEKRFTLPRWIDKDTFGRQRLVVPPKLAAIALRSEVRRWWKKYGPELELENPVKQEIPWAA